MNRAEIRRETHTARREYRCDAPYGPCTRRILRGQTYTLICYPPGTPPFKSPTWTNIRACSACATLPAGVEIPCPIGSDGLQCSKLIDHEPPHDYPIGLF